MSEPPVFVKNRSARLHVRVDGRLCAIFATLSLPQFRQMGFGLAVSIDATVVRAVLLPAAMKLLGDGTGARRTGSTGPRASRRDAAARRFRLTR